MPVAAWVGAKRRQRRGEEDEKADGKEELRRLLVLPNQELSVAAAGIHRIPIHLKFPVDRRRKEVAGRVPGRQQPVRNLMQSRTRARHTLDGGSQDPPEQPIGQAAIARMPWSPKVKTARVPLMGVSSGSIHRASRARSPS